MTITDYFSEFMKQNFNDSLGVNYTPFSFMLFLKENDYYFTNKRVEDLSRYVFRFYIDNLQLSKQNSNVLISNIEHYSVNDIKPYVIEQLKIWMKNGSGIVLFDGDNVYINEEFSGITDNDKKMLNKIIENMCIRNFSKSIDYCSSISTDMYDIKKYIGNFEDYTSYINKTRYIKRAYEDFDYCVCCEETNRLYLQPVHIDITSDLFDPNNSLIFCKEHARLYYDGYFLFDQFGKIIINRKHQLLDSRMHLSQKVLQTKKVFIYKKIIESDTKCELS